ncbi:MAG: lipoyl(octanoyl) transferase LipB [Pseudomonadota bacterium]
MEKKSTPTLKTCKDQIDWLISEPLVPYPQAIDYMRERVPLIGQKKLNEAIWCLEHPSLYTCGTSGHIDDLENSNLPFYKTGRGGQITYHGPGQRIVYVMMRLSRFNLDIHHYVRWIEQWVITLLAKYSIKAFRRSGRVGIWVYEHHKDGSLHENKIAAIGIRVSRAVSWHGFCVNLNPDMQHYQAITPCGIDPAQYGVTSLYQLGVKITNTEFDDALIKTMPKI